MVIIPTANFNAYYGTTTFAKSFLPVIPEDVIVKENMQNVDK